MKKDLLLLLSLMLLLSVSAIAGPRSYLQAKAIAQRGSPDIFRGKNFLILQKIYTFVP